MKETELFAAGVASVVCPPTRMSSRPSTAAVPPATRWVLNPMVNDPTWPTLTSASPAIAPLNFLKLKRRPRR